MTKQTNEPVKYFAKPAWAPLLQHIEFLHANSLHPPFPPLPFSWEEIAPNGELGIVFGHLDTVNIACDLLCLAPQKAFHQMTNLLTLQREDGFIPGWVVCGTHCLHVNDKVSSPPLWAIVVEDYFNQTQNMEALRYCYPKILKQISWFEEQRNSEEGGFYYLDCMDRIWESGVVEGVRFDLGGGAISDFTCVDATSHVYKLYQLAGLWAERLNEDSKEWKNRAKQLQEYIQNELFDSESGFFYDKWMVDDQRKRRMTFEGFWPLICGAASDDQAQRVVDENLIQVKRFFTSHPIPSVSLEDPAFEQKFWRGPTRNSLAYWAARGATNYGRIDVSKIIVEKALDSTLRHFQQTGALWEYYCPIGGNPQTIPRGDGELKGPCRDHLGANPLIAMAKMWSLSQKTGEF